ncbi:MAG: LytR C-terminal domain-containing protein [Burkholderiales bacterium]|nr:LytR C-terminal domain-containing protein [Burkholderiales bacterium]
MEAFERAEALDPANQKILTNLRGTREKIARKQLVSEHKAAALLQSASATTHPLRFAPQVIANDLGAMRLVEVNPNVYELRAPQPIAANLGVTAGLPISAGLATEKPTAEKPAIETLKTIGVEVSNGNGITGMAKRVARFFKSQGIAIARLTNQKHFNRPVTTIEYRDGYRDRARALNSRLPKAGTIVQANDLREGIAVRLVLGTDLSRHLAAFDTDIELASNNQPR